MADQKQQAYLIYPRLGGLANDNVVQLENGPILYHVQSKLLAAMGKSYTICDDQMNKLMETKQDHTFMFPVHTVLEKGQPVASVGQVGFMPQNYFIRIGGHPRLVIKIQIFNSIFDLEGPQGSVAQIAQYRSKWIVAIDTDQNCAIILPLLAVIYREYSIGG